MAGTAYIRSLLLSQFRSYEALDVKFDGRPVVLFGQNGAGKTNLLEAISLLSPGRGLRRAKLPQILRQTQSILGQNNPDSQTIYSPELWAISAQLERGDDVHKIGTGQIEGAPNRRQIRIDGQTKSGTDLARRLTINWLTPAQDRLFTGPASDRRKFLDRLCLVHQPAHGRTSLAYEKSRSERNRLFANDIHDDYWFDALETDMAERGALIAQARFETVEQLKHEIADQTDSGQSLANQDDPHNFPLAHLDLNGEVEALFADRHDGIGPDQPPQDNTEIVDWIKTQLRADRNLDRRAGRTLRGVHKTDLLVTHRAKNMPASLCSTGEQKALLIGLILAHARSQADKQPILLLDEVVAHLDEHRRAALIEQLIALGTHVFMTGTDAHLFSAFGTRAQMFEVCDGELCLKENPF